MYVSEKYNRVKKIIPVTSLGLMEPVKLTVGTSQPDQGSKHNEGML